jgi:hypothetical protein
MSADICRHPYRHSERRTAVRHSGYVLLRRLAGRLRLLGRICRMSLRRAWCARLTGVAHRGLLDVLIEHMFDER